MNTDNHPNSNSKDPKLPTLSQSSAPHLTFVFTKTKLKQVPELVTSPIANNR